jgi:hypothetical protein
MNPEDGGYEKVRRLVACTGLLTLAGGLLFGGLSTGAELTEVLGFLLTLASLPCTPARNRMICAQAHRGELLTRRSGLDTARPVPAGGPG